MYKHTDDSCLAANNHPLDSSKAEQFEQKTFSISIAFLTRLKLYIIHLYLKFRRRITHYSVLTTRVSDSLKWMGTNVYELSRSNLQLIIEYSSVQLDDSYR